MLLKCLVYALDIQTPEKRQKMFYRRVLSKYLTRSIDLNTKDHLKVGFEES